MGFSVNSSAAQRSCGLYQSPCRPAARSIPPVRWTRTSDGTRRRAFSTDPASSISCQNVPSWQRQFLGLSEGRADCGWTALLEKTLKKFIIIFVPSASGPLERAQADGTGFPLALRADLNYNKFTFKSDLPFSPGVGTGGTITTTQDLTQQIIGGLANIAIPFRMGPVTPYVTAGLAGFNIKTKLSEVQSGAEDESETNFAVNGGAGVSLRLLGASAFIEAKINNVYADKQFISNTELKSLQFVPVTFGFIFWRCGSGSEAAGTSRCEVPAQLFVVPNDLSIV